MSVLNANDCEGNVIISMNISVVLFSSSSIQSVSLIKVSHREYTLLTFSFWCSKKNHHIKSHFKLEQQFKQPFSCSSETLLFACLFVWSVLLLNTFPQLMRNMTRLYVELMCTI